MSCFQRPARVTLGHLGPAKCGERQIHGAGLVPVFSVADPHFALIELPFGMTYSVFINGLSRSGITVDRKVLSDLAINEPAAFQAIAEKAKAALAA